MSHTVRIVHVNVLVRPIEMLSHPVHIVHVNVWSRPVELFIHTVHIVRRKFFGKTSRVVESYSSCSSHKSNLVRPDESSSHTVHIVHVNVWSDQLSG